MDLGKRHTDIQMEPLVGMDHCRYVPIGAVALQDMVCLLDYGLVYDKNKDL